MTRKQYISARAIKIFSQKKQTDIILAESGGSSQPSIPVSLFLTLSVPSSGLYQVNFRFIIASLLQSMGLDSSTVRRFPLETSFRCKSLQSILANMQTIV